MAHLSAGLRDNPVLRPLPAAVVAGLVAVATYLPQCGYALVADDAYVIEKNPIVQGGPWLQCLTEPYWPRSFSTDPLYRPVATLSFRLNYALFGDAPLSYRIVNALLHGLCSALVALLAVRLWRHSAAGWVAGLLFAVHPVHADAVALIVGRAELLAAVFSVAVLHRHLGYLHGSNTPSAAYHAATTLLFLLAISSKEHATAVLPAMVCLDIWARRPDASRLSFRERLNRLVASHYLGLILALGAFLFARWLIFGGRTTLPVDQVNPLANPLIAASTLTRVATPLALLFLSLRLLVAPFNLCPIWSIGGFDVPETLWRFDAVAGAAAVAALVMVGVLGLRRRRHVGLLVAWLALFLILPCHFVPAANWLFAERWLYLPSVFLVLLVGGIGRYVRGWLTVALVVVGIVSFGATWRYQRCWQDTAALMRAVVDRHPYSYHGLIGHLSQTNRAGRLLEAEPYVQRLMERFPDSPRTWYYHALLMDLQGRPQRTLDAVFKFIQLNGPNPLPEAMERVQTRAREALRGSSAPSHVE